MKLSDHFYLREFTRSSIASRYNLSNIPTSDIIINLERTANTLEKIRTALGNKRIFILSGYRSLQVNTQVHGSKTSAHMDGRASDIEVEGIAPIEVARRIHASGIVLDQLILEFDEWVHVGIHRIGEKPRGDIFTAMHEGGRVVYKSGLISRIE